MKVAPPRTPFRPKPVALLIPGYRHLTVQSVDGTKVAAGREATENLLASLSGHVCYVPRALRSLRHTTGAQHWTLHSWRGHEARMAYNPTGLSITSLRGTLDDSDDPFMDLTRALAWLRGYGVAPGSISQMAWSLWRASLPAQITISADPEFSRAAFYGGRQEIIEPRNYQHMAAVDIRAAYPCAMASHDYALSLREVSAATTLDPDIPGIARATVGIPTDLPYAVVPQRVARHEIQFRWGIVTGSWPWCELAAAAALGCDIKVHQSWAPRRTGDLFGTWWSMAQTGRSLPGAASMLAKAVANSLWGQFAMSGDEHDLITWADEAGNDSVSTPQPNRSLPHLWTCHIAAETTARVRVRLLTEGMYGSRVRPVHVDTDGIIIRASEATRAPEEPGNATLGTWQVKERMSRLQIRAPQVYRYTCGAGCGVTHARWHYVASGYSRDAAPLAFRDLAAGTRISVLASPDTCLPPV